MTTPDWTERLHLSRDLARDGRDTRELSRAALRGDMVRVRRGAYTPAGVWGDLSFDERHVLRVTAVALAADIPPVFSHRSAAAVLGLPLLRRETDVHVVCAVESGGRSGHGVARHGVSMEKVTVTIVDGLLVTSLERTLIDIAATEPFASAVMAFDHALATDLGRRTPLTTKQRIHDELTFMNLGRHWRRVEAVLAFAVTCSGSPGESLSRARMHELHFAAPDLQVEFRHHTGIVDRVDFDWPGVRVFGEFDGHGKYLNPRLRQGLSTDEVVIEEKRRENRLRTQRDGAARWEWIDALHPARLCAILLDAGVPRTK